MLIKLAPLCGPGQFMSRQAAAALTDVGDIHHQQLQIDSLKEIPMATGQRAEATGKPKPSNTNGSVTWRGEQFTLPSAQDFPLAALEAEEDGKHLTALKCILGVDQYATWRNLAATAADAEDFSAVVMKELGRGNP
ncbi:hypothetical protein [Amycolatopsis sp. NPDC059657]|uniref:hypothetical protein n=1 Tax=Amycolatopsis sp. NPDC059657 TaxID=3346899 RepID=UPI00366BE1B6